MSESIELAFLVRRLIDEDQAKSVMASIDGLLREQGLRDDVTMGWSILNDLGWMVGGESLHPFPVSQADVWCSEFEQTFQQCVSAVAPDADIRVKWGDPYEGW
ncbi:hypothetical protein ACIBEK_16275 [Nocardia fusca]|uniref:hypothetical protein n=1 Tax=Nocardia fusca TaxID=941183 RepID=UPI0037A30468